MTTMTHFVFGRYAPGAGSLRGSAGEVVPGAGTGNRANVEEALIAKAHANDVKALMMLGGAGDGKGFDASTADPATREAFIDALLAKLAEKDYDGVDVDWEESLTKAVQQNQLLTFLTELRAAAADHPRYKKPNDSARHHVPGLRRQREQRAAGAGMEGGRRQSRGPVQPDDLWAELHCCRLADLALFRLDGRRSQTSHLRGEQREGLRRRGRAPQEDRHRARAVREVLLAARDRSAAAHFRAAGGGEQDSMDNYRNFRNKGLLDHPNGTYVWDEAAQTGYYSYSPPVIYQKRPTAKQETISMLTLEEPRSIAAKGAWARAGNCGGTIVWTINYGYMPTVGNPPMEAVKRAFLIP